MLLGLAAAAFPELSADAVIELACENGLEILEWNDAHVPAGNLKEAERIRLLVEEKGLRTISYAARFSVLTEAAESFSRVLKTADALGTDTVCLNTGLALSSIDAAEASEQLVLRVKELSDMAKKAGMKLCFFYRRDAFFDDYLRVVYLMEEINRDNVFLNWQPKLTSSLIFNIFELKMLLRYVQHVYIYYKDPTARNSLIIEGQDEWQQYMKVLKEKEERAIMFRGCSKESFADDCVLLKEWLQKS